VEPEPESSDDTSDGDEDQVSEGDSASGDVEKFHSEYILPRINTYGNPFDNFLIAQLSNSGQKVENPFGNQPYQIQQQQPYQMPLIQQQAYQQQALQQQSPQHQALQQQALQQQALQQQALQQQTLQQQQAYQQQPYQVNPFSTPLTGSASISPFSSNTSTLNPAYGSSPLSQPLANPFMTAPTTFTTAPFQGSQPHPNQQQGIQTNVIQFGQNPFL